MNQITFPAQELKQALAGLGKVVGRKTTLPVLQTIKLKAGFVMLPNLDAGGSRTAQQAVGNTMALLLASLCPFALGLNGKTYLVAALILGAGYCWTAIRFAQQLTAQRARQLFLASIIYLPLLIAVLVGNKLK